MRVWLIKDGENSPSVPGARMMRTGMLAKELVSRGHSVIWWTSTFSHQRKKLMSRDDDTLSLGPNLVLKLLHAGEYHRNISFARYLHHKRFARRFRYVANTLQAPDIVVSAFPQIHVSYEAVRYAQGNLIPVIVDIRDLWPDVLTHKTPGGLRTLVRVALTPDYRATRYALCHATNLVATSRGYLSWGLAQAGRAQTQRDRVFYIGYPAPIQGSAAIPACLQKLKSNESDKVLFTFVGSFGHSYELGLVSSVARQMWKQNISDAHFILAGEGQQLEQLSRETSDLPNVTITGWLDALTIQDLLAMSHVGLLPCNSVVDTIPNKLFEYLSAGLPVLSSLQGEADQIIRENGLGFTYGVSDRAEMYRGVLTLLRDKRLRDELGRNSKKAFRSKFMAESVYPAFADHIEETARGQTSAKSKQLSK